MYAGVSFQVFTIPDLFPFLCRFLSFDWGWSRDLGVTSQDLQLGCAVASCSYFNANGGVRSPEGNLSGPFSYTGCFLPCYLSSRRRAAPAAAPQRVGADRRPAQTRSSSTLKKVNFAFSSACVSFFLPKPDRAERGRRPKPTLSSLMTLACVRLCLVPLSCHQVLCRLDE